jgi:hypothetical protein
VSIAGEAEERSEQTMSARAKSEVSRVSIAGEAEKRAKSEETA